jgi:four helix bundle protein
MATVLKFEELEVWQEAKVLVKAVYSATSQGKFARDFGLRDQIQRASVSIMSNVAEGFERGTNKEFAQFLYIAKGSAGEVRSLLHIAFELGYLDQTSFQTVSERAVGVSRRLSNFIKYLQNSTPRTREITKSANACPT